AGTRPLSLHDALPILHQIATDPTEGAIQVSPSGDRLYWSGTQYGSPVTDYRKDNYVTNAFNTSSGTFTWSRTYNSPAHGEDDARSEEHTSELQSPDHL